MTNITENMLPIKVVGLGGSLAVRSASRAALEIALKGAEEAGAQIELFDVRGLDLPMYDPDSNNVPEAARRLAESLFDAYDMLWSSPLHHGDLVR